MLVLEELLSEGGRVRLHARAREALLKRFAFVGATDEWDASVLLFHSDYGWLRNRCAAQAALQQFFAMASVGRRP